MSQCKRVAMTTEAAVEATVMFAFFCVTGCYAWESANFPMFR